MMDYEAFKDLIENRIPFNKYLGIRLRTFASGVCVLYIPYRDELVGDFRRGALHGGVISTLVDTAGGFAVWAMSGINDRIATIDMRVDYLKPVPQGQDLVAESRISLHGYRVGNARTKVYTDDAPDVVLAEGRGVYNIRKARS